MSRAWRRAAADSFLLSLSRGRPCRARSAFSVQSVERTTVRFATSAGVALAEAQTAIAFGAATSVRASTARAHGNKKRRSIHGSVRALRRWRLAMAVVAD